MLKRIDASSVLQICSSQVITDLKSAVKELVENSLDAESTSLELRFFGHGLYGFEVTDNGKGIEESSFDILCKRGTTSKIEKYEDIYSIKSLGFCGEALSSLCSMGCVSVKTRKHDEDTGFQLEYDKAGTLVSKEKISKNPGTTVTVRNMFKDLPVRLGEFRKTHKAQYSKCIALMQQYALVSTHVRMIVQNSPNQDSGPYTDVLRTTAKVRFSPENKDEWTQAFG